MPYDVTLGRLTLVSALDDLPEEVGGAVDAVGKIVVAAEERPLKLGVTLPIYASTSSANPALIGQRLRRQIRSLLNNTQVVIDGLYFTFAVDSDLNCWLVPEPAEITEGGKGGITFSSWTLPLTAYRVGAARTHSRAMRFEIYDVRSPTTARDYRKTIVSSDFSSMGYQPVGPLPPLASNWKRLATGVVPSAFSRTSRYGDFYHVLDSGLGDFQSGDVFTYDITEANRNNGDVLVWDRRGNTGNPTPAQNPQDDGTTFGWEEVYGPDYPLTVDTDADAIPVMENGLCRLRWLSQAGTLVCVVDQHEGTSWVERCRVYPQTVHVFGTNVSNSVMACAVVEWSPNRAVVRVDFNNAISLYVTLQRGWTGPRFEVYTSPYSASDTQKSGAEIVVQQNFTGIVSAVRGEAGATEGAWAYRSDIAPWTGGASGDFSSPRENWLAVVGDTRMMTLAVVRAAERFSLDLNNTAYGGATRPRIRIGSYRNDPGGQYGSVQLGFSSIYGGVREAETDRNASGTTTQVADSTPSGQVVEESQASQGNLTILATLGASVFGFVPPSGWAEGNINFNVRVVVYARVVTAGATGSFRLRNNSGGAMGDIVTTTSTSYVWLDLGELTVSGTNQIGVYSWRSAGTGAVRIDHWILVPTTDQQHGSIMTGNSGAREVGEQALAIVRARQVQVAR